MAKPEKQKQALELRHRGLSIKQIAHILEVSVGNTHRWVRDVPLSDEIRVRLSQRGHQAAKLVKNKDRIQRILDARGEAETDWVSLKTNPDFTFGLALYLGEGAKTTGSVAVTNCDPSTLRAAIRFFTLVGCDMSRAHCQVILHQGEDPDAAVRYWSRELSLAPEAFHRVTASKVSGGKRAHHLIHGTASVRVCHTRVKHKIMRWLELAKETWGRTLPTPASLES